MKNVLLLILAIILAPICFALGFLFTIGRIIWKWRRKKLKGYFSNTSLAFALAIDHFGNVVCRDMFNSLLIDHGGYAFGDIRETVSSALGKNQRRGTLTGPGKALAWVLDTLDPGHCLRAISELQDASN